MFSSPDLKLIDSTKSLNILLDNIDVGTNDKHVFCGNFNFDCFLAQIKKLKKNFQDVLI